MYSFRITKYNPIYRDERGAYQKNEWICYGEIGKTFDGQEFTLAEYERVENTYIQAVVLFMECLNIDSLQITHLEKDGRRSKQASIKGIKIKNHQIIKKEMIPFIIRLILRTVIWAKLESNDMFVHFGWDYYMFIGSTKPCDIAIRKIEQSGLFVELFESPYLYLDEDDE